MSRKKRSAPINYQNQRDIYSLQQLRASQSVNASHRLELERRRRLLDQVAFEQLINRQIEDRRRFHPEGGFRPALDRKMRVAKVAAQSVHNSRMRFTSPFSGVLPSPMKYAKRVLICVRRKVRREVLFASGGGGGRAKRSRRRNAYSGVNC